jgi:hypothetical protein
MTQFCKVTINRSGSCGRGLLLTLLCLLSHHSSLAFTINRMEIKTLSKNIQPLRLNDFIQNSITKKRRQLSNPATILLLSTTHTIDEIETEDSFKNYTSAIADKIKWLDSDDVISKQIEKFSDDEVNDTIQDVSSTSAILEEDMSHEENQDVQQPSKPFYRRPMSDLDRTLNKLAEQAGRGQRRRHKQ